LRYPAIKECEVIVNFPDSAFVKPNIDDGSLAYLFKDYVDDGIREPIVVLSSAVGNEKW